MNTVTYSKKTCVTKMLLFALSCLLAFAVIGVPYMWLFVINNHSDLNPTLVAYGFGIILYIILLIALSIHSKKEKLGIWAFKRDKMNTKVLMLSLALGVLWQLIVVVEYYLFAGAYPLNTQTSIASILTGLFCLVILTPLTEELIFRKWIVDMMQRANFSNIAIVITSAIAFFLMHLGQNIIRIDTLIIAIPLCLIYMKYGDIRYCIIAHALNNLLAIICANNLLMCN